MKEKKVMKQKPEDGLSAGLCIEREFFSGAIISFHVTAVITCPNTVALLIFWGTFITGVQSIMISGVYSKEAIFITMDSCVLAEDFFPT